MNGDGNRILYKIVMFIIVIGGLILIGRNQMKANNIDKDRVSVDDVKNIFEDDLIGEIDFIEIQIDTANGTEVGYSNPVMVKDKNSIYYLRNELNNCKFLNEEEAMKNVSYESCPVVTFYLSDGTILYSAISKGVNGKTVFFIAHNADMGDKKNYELLVDDDIQDYVISLYNKNSGVSTETDTTNTQSADVTNSINNANEIGTQTTKAKNTQN